MTIDALPPDLTQFIQEEFATGHYASEQEVVQKAVRFFRDSRARYLQLREEIRQSIADLDAGHGTVIETDEELSAFFEEIESEVQREFGKS
jgi:putative addiction module CopG family antidote